MFASSGDDRLAPVLFKDVPLSRSSDHYQIGADVFLDSVDEKGSLLEAIKHYFNYLESNSKIPSDKRISMTATYTVEYDKIEVPVAGSFQFVVQFP